MTATDREIFCIPNDVAFTFNRQVITNMPLLSSSYELLWPAQLVQARRNLMITFCWDYN